MAKAEDKFSLLDVIKEDQYGAVYLFEDKVQHELLVIKKRSNSNAGFRESKLLHNLHHPNIVKVKGVSKNDRVFISVMEYLKGGCLQDRLIKPFGWKTFISLASQICEAMDYAHRNNIIHGNLRPRNILFTSKGWAKISDFGFDEHYGSDQEGGNWYNYLGEEKSVKTDIYAAGALFYQMLTASQKPPEWQSGELCTNTQFDALPQPLQGVILNMMQRDPSERYGGFSEVLVELEAISLTRKNNGSSEQEVLEVEPEKGEARFSIVLGITLLLAIATSAFVYFAGNGPRTLEYLQLSMREAITWVDVLRVSMQSYLSK
ncbi:MAG: protein kinase [Pseudomonadales bacterium]|nr:protein kinase [Pseudomonadales bacterium]